MDFCNQILLQSIRDMSITDSRYFLFIALFARELLW